MKNKPRRSELVNKSTVPQPGIDPFEARQNYVRGSTGKSRPAPSDTYTLDGTDHRFDGKCHTDCENVR